ncbi:MAG: ABC transporter substrate-binding protein [Anaerolineales bacterium]|nr:ABC transporter substrate-binding protein [Anaerolineales bacterium]
MPRPRAFITLLLAAAIVLAGCAAPATAPSGTTVSAPTAAPTTQAGELVVLRVGWGDRPDSLNPAYAFLASSYVIFDSVYSSLVKEGPDGKYRGDLAQSWEASSDGLTWTFKLKSGIQWHNGEPLTAEDVVWSINEIKNDPEGWATLVNYTNGFAEVTAPDAQTVRIVTEYPISNMEYRVSFLYALWRPDFEPLATTEDLQNFTNEKLIGTGAFKLVQYDKEQGLVVLERNPDFYDGPARVDRVIFRAFDNSDALIQAFRAGELDVLYSVPSAALETVKGFPNVTVVQTPSRSFDELIINSVPKERVATSTGNPALLDPKVRQALAHALNKQDIVDVVLQGLGQPGWSIVAPVLGGGFWHNNMLSDYAYDPAKANALLDEAGYVKGADGIREKDGVRLDFRLQFDADSADYARTASLMVDMFQAVGVKVTPEALDSDTLTANTTGVGDYDLVIWGWGGDPDPDFILSIMLCDQFVIGGWNDSGYCNEEYDRLYLEQQKAVDPAARQKIIYRMQELLLRDLPYIVLYNYDSLQAYRSDRFTNFPDYVANPSLTVGLTSAEVLRQVEPVR